MKLKVYTFHRGISADRFDAHNTHYLLEKLQERYKVEWLDLAGHDGYRYHDVLMDYGSAIIVEFEETGRFRVYDFGDAPKLAIKLCKLDLFDGAAIGQYNPTLWNELVPEGEKRCKIIAGPYPESRWQLGLLNYDTVQEYRSQIDLDKRLHWRGSLYSAGVPTEYLGVRRALELLPNYLSPQELHFGNYPIPFEDYIQEVVNYSLALSFGGGGGYICGDFCFRDIEMYGLGIPTLRPIYAVEAYNQLIPNHHYVAVDVEFTEEYRYADPDKLASNISKRYKEVIDDKKYLEYVANNARKWYLNTIGETAITNNIITALQL